jgi:hypothetical protein
MFKFLKKTRKYGWMSLGGILLCMTGMLINICVMDIYRNPEVPLFHSIKYLLSRN